MLPARERAQPEGCAGSVVVVVVESGVVVVPGSLGGGVGGGGQSPDCEYCGLCPVLGSGEVVPSAPVDEPGGGELSGHCGGLPVPEPVWPSLGAAVEPWPGL